MPVLGQGLGRLEGPCRVPWVFPGPDSRVQGPGKEGAIQGATRPAGLTPEGLWTLARLHQAGFWFPETWN